VVLTIATPGLAAADVDDDCINANEKSIELRTAGKLLEARAETARCAIEACPQEVQRVCGLRAQQITAALPTIVFEVKDDAGADISGVRLSIDGRPMDSAGTVTAVALDPGDHVFVFEIPGQAARIEKSFVLREGERQRRERVTVIRSPAPAASPRLAGAPPMMVVDDSAPGRIERTIGLVIGGAGVAGLIVGGIFGLAAKSKWEEAQANCKPGCAPDAPAQQTKSEAQSAATLATISTIAGGALLVGGGALFFLAPSSNSTKGVPSSIRVVPEVGMRGASLSLGAVF
jgi:serine/threonine-protein kinase